MCLIYYAVVKYTIINVSNLMFCTVHVLRNSAQNMEILHEIWSFGSQENHLICCHQMSDFKAKMHQIQFWLELCPRPIVACGISLSNAALASQSSYDSLQGAGNRDYCAV